MPSFSRAASVLSRSLILLLAAAVLLAHIGGVRAASDVALAALVAFVILEWRNLPRLARLFAAGSVVAVVAVLWLRPDATAQIVSAMRQSTTFACLLAMLGVLRYPARRSRLVARAAAWLVSRRPRHAYAALSFGGHFLSLLFNVGILPLIGDMIRKAGGRFGEGEPGREMMLAGMRGMSLMTIWSPMGIGFAIVTTSTAGLDPVKFLFVAFAAAMILLAVSCLTATPVESSMSDEEAAAAKDLSVMPLLRILAACLALMVMTIVLHDLLSVSFIVATILILPVFSVVWLLLEGDGSGQPATTTLRIGMKGIFATLADMRTEATFFAAATVIGAALTIFISAVPGWDSIAESRSAGLPILILCLLAVPVTAALAIPHTIVIVLAAQLFGHSPLGAGHPMALALALTIGWSLAIAVSPVSATTLITAAQAGVRSHVVGLVWNRRYVLIQAAVSIVMVSLAYVAGI
ncbi:hypothetical protein NOF55_00400 [Rhizobiaceae bacterium BDR2-2]|uniref:Uncharacterized protein n=1 Tax=Ectorhizobium quercum TaxID=2965071 RepID=A0AAE3MXN0_9HYPH|nr:hypothetical protein [Ectorhizobium quercum]MCX8995565.1 hypothetical protein [Ectorhizobium quercum]